MISSILTVLSGVLVFIGALLILKYVACFAVLGFMWAVILCEAAWNGFWNLASKPFRKFLS